MTKNSFTKQDLVACGRGELFGEGNSQLPVDNMLMIDRIVHISEEGGDPTETKIIENGYIIESVFEQNDWKLNFVFGPTLLKVRAQFTEKNNKLVLQEDSLEVNE